MGRDYPEETITRLGTQYTAWAKVRCPCLPRGLWGGAKGRPVSCCPTA